MEKLQYGRKKNAADTDGEIDGPVFTKEVFKQFDRAAPNCLEDGTPFSFRLRWAHRRYGPKKLVGYEFALDRRVSGRVRLVSQTMVDSYMVKTGWSGERQFGEPDFDDRIFVDCDDKLLIEQVLGRRAQREACLSLFDQGCSEICIDHKGAVAVMPDDKVTENLDGEDELACLSRQVAVQGAWLARLTASLPLFVPSRASRPWRRGAVAGWGLIIGPLFLFLPAAGLTGNVLPTIDFKGTFLKTSFLLAVAWAVFSFMKNRGTAAPHRQAAWQGLGAFGALALLMPIVGYLNHDDAAPRHAAAYVDAGKSYTRKGTTYYEVRAVDFLDSNESFWFPASKQEYELAQQRRACLHFDLHPGRFDLPYYSKMHIREIGKASDCPSGPATD